MEKKKAAAARKVFDALWQTRNRGDSVPIALEQQGVEVFDPDEIAIENQTLDVSCDGVDLIIIVKAV